METEKSNANEVISNSDKTGNSFIEFLIVVVKYRWFLFWSIFIITASVTIFALLEPKWYKATTSVLPAENTDFLSAFSGISSLVKNFSPSKGLAALSGNTEFDKYMAILKSSTMADDVIKKFNLQNEYKFNNSDYDKVVKEFYSNMELEVQDDGNLTLSIYDKNPQKAADIANYMINKLNEINIKLTTTNAKANREFIQKRYFENVDTINSLESQMKDFQNKYGVVAVPEQIEATVKAMSTIYGDLAQKEIEYNVLKRTYGNNSPITTRAQIEVQEINKKINILNTGNPDSKNVNLLIPFKQAPELAYKYLKIYRDLEIQYKILEIVQPMYEQAKVEEVRNTPSVLVLDKAVPPNRKSKPKVSLYALISFVIALIFALFIVLLRELLNKIKIGSPDKYKYITSSLRADLSKIGIKKKEKS